MKQQPRIAGFVAETGGRYTTRKPLTPAQIIKAAKTLAQRQVKQKTPFIDCAGTSKMVFQAELEKEEREVFAALFLTTRHVPITFERIFYGTIDRASIYPREIVKLALKLNAAAVIVGHNHPSGNPEPTQADIDITHTIYSALSLIDIRLLDHIVVGKDSAVSLGERGIV